MHNWNDSPSFLWYGAILNGIILGVATLGLVKVLTWQDFPLPKSVIGYSCIGMVAALIFVVVPMEITEPYTDIPLKNSRTPIDEKKYEADLRRFNAMSQIATCFPSLGAVAGVGAYFIKRRS